MVMMLTETPEMFFWLSLRIVNTCNINFIFTARIRSKCSYYNSNFNAALRSNSVSLCVTALNDFFPMNIEVSSEGLNWVPSTTWLLAIS